MEEGGLNAFFNKNSKPFGIVIFDSNTCAFGAIWVDLVIQGVAGKIKYVVDYVTAVSAAREV